jgi:hypothetical protein
MTLRFVRPAHVAALSLALAVPAPPIAAVQSTPPGARTRPLAKQGYPALGAPAILSVTKAGAAPLRQFEVTMSMSVGTTYGTDNLAERDDRTIPTIAVTADLQVTSVEPNGEIAYDLAVLGMTPTKGRGTVSSSGVIKAMQLDVVHYATMPTNLAPIFDAVEHLVVPFPDVAVGVGARWEVREALEAGGVTKYRPTIFQKTEYEVVSIDGATVSLRVKTGQTGPAQTLRDPVPPFSNPAASSGPDRRLQSMSGSGTGTVVVHLNSLVPVSERQSRTSLVMTWMSDNQHPTASPVEARTIDATVKIAIAPPGGPDKFFDVKALRGIKAVNLGGTGYSTVGPGRVCYPRAAGDPGSGVRMAMGGLLQTTMESLKAGGINTSPRSADILRIDAQVRDAEHCHATITLELHRGREAVNATWRRTFEIEGPPAGFIGRVLDRLQLDVQDFVRDIALANRRK